MSSKLEEKKKQLIALLDEATSSKNAELVNEAFGKIKKIELKITATIRRLKKVDDCLKNNNRPQAKKIYKAFFFDMSKPDFGSLKKIKAKRVFKVEEIEKFLDNRSKLSKMIRNLKKAHRTFSLVLAPAAKVIKVYTMICNTKENLKKALEVYDLYQAQKTLKTAKDYQQYYKKAGDLFGEAADAMKIVTAMLPRGASDYCDYILTVASNCENAVKIVSNYTDKILKESRSLDDFLKNVYGKKSYSLSGNAAGYNDLEKGLDTELNNK